MSVSSAPRIGWIDATRGSAMIVVVLGHVWRGLFEADIIDNRDLYQRVDQAIYLFHMPVFFILSGLVFRKGVIPKVSTFLTLRFTRIVYPLLLWYYIFIGIGVLASAHTNRIYSMEQLLSFPTPFGTHLWFLWALFVIHLVCTPLIFAASRKNIIIFSSILVILTISIRYGFDYKNSWFNQAIIYLPFFIIGVISGEFKIDKHLQHVYHWHLIIGGATALILTQFLRFFEVPIPVLNLALGMPAALGFILLISGGFALSAANPPFKILVKLGQASMAIYLAHIFFTAFSRVALNAVSIQDVLLHLVIGTLFGVVGPFFLYTIAGRLSLRRGLGF